MANKKMSLSKDGKELLDELTYSLDLDRPLVIKMALAKGISTSESIDFDYSSTPKWTIPENIIRNEEFLMFKHLVISNKGKELSEDDLNKSMSYFIEKGVRVLNDSVNNKNSLEDSRFVIL
ncbi:DndE family protein [Halobacillus salinus]|uniref:DndE family protein n=1 Tax=Halobacillus salinus TaxID=192814 RepID=UPI0009A5D3D9|nr:DndE family protein [Halobacillus salinus]